MKNKLNLTKRIMAVVLTLCMMCSSMASYVPGWFEAFAEETKEEAPRVETAAQPAGEEQAAPPVDGGQEPPAAEPAPEAPLTEQPVSEEAVSGEPVSEAPVSEEPVSEEPVSEEPVSEEPASEEPVCEELASEEPAPEAPVSEESVSEEPVSEEPVSEEPVSEEPASEEPVSEEPASEEPVSEEPVSEEPASEEPASEEPVSEEPVSEEPASEEPAEAPVDYDGLDAEALDALASEALSGAPDIIAADPAGAGNAVVPDANADTSEDEPALDVAPMLTEAVEKAGSDGKDDTKTKVFLQNEIDSKLAAIAGKLNERVEVRLKKNTRYEGDITITAGDRAVGSDFVLELVTDDAGETLNQGGGATVIVGNVVIKGLKVVMNSVLVDSSKKITVENRSDSTNKDYQSQGGSLEYNGTINAPNEFTMVVGKNSQATVNIADNDNIINFETKTGAKSLTVNTAGGVDTVRADIYDGDVTINTGGGADTLTLTVQGTQAGKVDVVTGSGMDTVNITAAGAAEEIKVDAGEDDDTIAVDVRENAGSLYVDTGAGNDSVTVIKGNHNTLESVYTDATVNVDEVASQNSTAVLTIDGADKGDRVTVIASTALAIKGVNIVGEGASVMLRGELAKIDDPITYIDSSDPSKGFRLHTWLESEGTALSGERVDYTLDITGSANNNYTDSLANKKTVVLDNPTSGSYVYDGAKNDFTNYVLKNRVNGLKSITVTGSDRPLLLSNVVLDSETTKDDDDHIKIADVTAQNLNVLITGEEIDLNGTIKAQNVSAQSYQGTKRIMQVLSNMGSVSLGDTLADLINVENVAIINVNGTVEAANDIELVTSVRHTGTTLNILPVFMNLINIKLADAEININEGAKLIAGKNFTADAKTSSNTGFAYTTKEENGQTVAEQQKFGMPLAVTWVVDSASIKVAAGASVKAGSDLSLNSSGSIKAGNYAESSTIPSPVDIALTVITNHVGTKVNGTLEAGGRVRVNATGSVEDETLATGASSYGALSGGFIAVNVVDQEVDAIIGEGAKVTAGGDLQLYSTGYADVKTGAVAAAAEEGDDGVTLAGAFSSLGGAIGGAAGGAIMGVLSPVFGAVSNTAWKYKAKWFGGNDAEGNKLAKSLKKAEKLAKSVGSGNYTAKVIDTDADNAKMGSATVTTEEAANAAGKTVARVTARPKSGCGVQKVRYRYMKPGEDHYTYVDVPYAAGQDCTFEMPASDVEVIVTYSGIPDGRDDEQPQEQAGGNGGAGNDDDGAFIDIGGLFDDLNDGVAGDPDDDDFQIEGEGDVEVRPLCDLAFDSGMKGGKVLTWVSGSDDENLKRVYTGMKIRLVPNPEKGKKLASMKVIYTKSEGDAEVAESVQVTADAQGRYVFTVPDGVPENTQFTVYAEFQDGDTVEEEHSDFTGSVAVSVVNNDNHVTIESGTDVNVGGEVDMFGFKINKVNTVADGSPVTAANSKKKDKDKDNPFKPTVQSSYGVGGAEYALRMSSNVSGVVKGAVGNKQAAGATAYHPVFTVDKDAQEHLNKIVLSYYFKIEANPVSYFMDSGTGTRRTVEFVRVGDEWKLNGSMLDELLKELEFKEDKDGNLVVTANMTGMGILQGTTADIDFVFDEDAQDKAVSDSGDGESVTATAGEAVYLIRNPIQVKYNILRNKDNYSETKSMGTLTFSRKTTDEKGVTRYYFTVLANEDAGYTIEALDKNDVTQTKSGSGLYASWIAANGTVQKAALKRNHDVYGTAEWYIEPAGSGLTIPEGAVISINATFSEDVREVSVSQTDAQKKQGSASVSKSKAKRTDKIEVALKAKDGWTATGIKVVYFDRYGVQQTLDQKKITYNKSTGKYEFEMPATSNADGSTVKITPVFAQKDIKVKATGAVDGGQQDKANVKLKDSSGKAAKGETITVSPSDELLEQGYKVTEVTLIYNNNQHKFANNNEVTIPSDLTASQVEIRAEMALKKIEVGSYTDAETQCTVKPKSGRADLGDKVIIEVDAQQGYRVKQGTLKARITTQTGIEQVVLTREGDGTYSFVMPGDAKEDAAVSIKCEFEPGSDGKAFSAGVGVAVAVVHSDNDVAIEGGSVQGGAGISLSSLSIGSKIVSESKAGYSEGNFGLGGAITVQVAKVNTNAYIRKGGAADSISVGDGSISLFVKGKNDYKVSADASGGKDGNATAGDNGVGAGIAVAVDHLEAIAEIEDGVRLVKYNAGLKPTGKKDEEGNEIFEPDLRLPNLTGLSVTSGQKTKDEVEAKAGAVGGSAWVPVAAVDVNTTDVKAYMGRLDLSALTEGLSKKKASELTDDEKLLKAGYLPVKGKVKIKADFGSSRVEYNHTITADASTAGASAAVGGAFIVNWINTDVKGKLNQSVDTNNAVDVISGSGDALKAIATASSAGGAKGTNKDKEEDKDGKKEGGADKKANQLLGGAANIAGKQGMDANAIKNDANDRQKAETAEDTVSVAGAFILNMQKNKSRAEIMDGVNVTANKAPLSVTSTNRIEATIRANASATESDTGVGVGIALNIVKMENIARIGTGTITAGSLTLSATMAKVPSYVGKRVNIENASNFRSELMKEVEAALKEIFPDNVASGVASEMIANVAGAVYDKLVDEFGLDQLLNIATDGGIEETFKNAGEILLQRLYEFPLKLASPFTAVVTEVEEIVKNTQDVGWEQWEALLLDALKTATVEVAGDASQSVKNLIKDNYQAVIAALMQMTADKIKGNGVDTSVLTKTMKEATNKALTDFVNKVVDTAVNKLNDKLPVVSQSNGEVIKRLYKEFKEKTWSEIGEDLFSYVSKTLREEVYDYEPILVKIQDKGFGEFIQEQLTGVLKTSTVALTNDTINRIVGKTKTQFTKEPKADRHVITTQAISGAGGKHDSGAGSLAIAVANLTTKAEIAGGTGAVTITDDGNMIINAEERRRTRTHATAAVDAAGEPDNNDGAGEDEDKKTGGSGADETTATKGQVSVTYGEDGGTIEFAKNEDGRVIIKPKEGYKVKEDSVIRSFTNAEGVEVIDTMEAEKYGDDWLIVPGQGLGLDQMEEEELEKVHVNVSFEFEEDLRTVPKASLITGGYGDEYIKKLEEAKADVKLSVEGKEGSGLTTQAKAGDLVEISVPRVDKIEAYRIDVYNERGDIIARYAFEPEYDRIPKGAQTMTKAMANANETVYVFNMPSGDVGKIDIILTQGGKRPDDDADPNASNENQDSAGRSVGVGASFALTYGGSDVEALIGKRAAGVKAGSIGVTASSEHEAENYSTAGTDPLEGVNDDKDSEKQVGVDASLAIDILDNDIKAEIAAGTKVTTTAKPESIVKEKTKKKDEDDSDGEKDDDVEYVLKPGDLIIHATESGENETKASAFATGSETAVGASVSLNISLSDIKATLGSGATVQGDAIVRAYSKSKDNNWSFASAMGSDMQRMLNKVSKGAELTQEKINGLADGSIFDEKAKDDKSKKKSNDTSKKVTDRLNNDKVKNKDGDDASENLPISVNALRSQNSQIDNGGEELANAQEKAQQKIQQEGNQDAQGQENDVEKKKLQVAATVGFTVAVHDAAVTVGGAISSGGDVLVTAQNAGNFNTRSSAFAMSKGKTGEGSKTIAAAIGVSVNSNKATVDMTGNVEAAGDVTVTADLTQNMSGVYPGKLAVQSIAGAGSPKNTKKAVAGSVSLVFSFATSTVKIKSAKKIEGNAVLVSATDKSKLGVRAGAVNVSSGANVGEGISIATIWSGNTVEAEIGAGATITADRFKLSADKKVVDWDDFVFPLSLFDLISDSSALSDEDRENVYPGVFDVHKKPGETSYTVDVNLDTYTLMKIPDLLNRLSSTNYYTEAIAGSVVTGGDDNEKTAAGSVSIVRASNTVKATLGNNITISKRGKIDKPETIIEAKGASNSRLIGGAASIGKAKSGVGVTITFMYDNDDVEAKIGNSVTITSGGDVTHSSNADTTVQIFNAAASVNTGDNAKKTTGGAIDLILLNNEARTTAGSNAKITADGALNVKADANMDLLMVNVGVAGGKKGTATGGTVALTFDNAAAKVNYGRNHTLTAEGDVSITSYIKDKMISIAASASAAAEAEGKAYAGAINVLYSGTEGTVKLAAGGTGNGITSKKGSVILKGEAESLAINVTASGAGSKGKAVGLSVNLNFFGRESGVDVKGGAKYAISAGKDVLTSAYGRDINVLAALAVAGGNGNAVGGNIGLIVSRNTVKDTIGAGIITAGGEAAFSSRLKDDTYAIAGSIAVSKDATGFGGTAMVVVKQNEATTDLGTATVTAAGSSGKLSEKLHDNPGFKGIYAGATIKNTLVTAAAGIAVAGDKGVTVNLLSSANLNDVKVDASKAALKAIVTDADGKVTGGGSIKVDAQNTTKQILISGGVNYGKAAGVGAGVTVLVSRGNVTALAHDLHAYRDINVNAEAHDDIFQLNVNAGGSNKTAVELGVSLQILKSKVNAVVASAVTAEKGSFTLKAKNTTDLVNATVALAGSGKYAVTPVVVVTTFGGETNAMLNAGTVKAAKGVNVVANSDKTIDQYTIGAAASGKAAVSGGVSIVTIKDSTNAVIGKSVNVTGKTLKVTADSNYTQTGVGAAVGIAGEGGVAVNVMVSVVKGNTLAEMEGDATLSGKATVKATSDRDVVNGVLTAGGGGKGGVGITVMVLAVGEKIDQDAADMMTYGNVTEKDDDNKALDTNALITKLKELGVNTVDLEEQKDADGNTTQTGLSQDLEGNGKSNKDMHAGDGQQFNVADGYTSDDVYDKDGDGSKVKRDETEDIKASKKLGDTVYTDSPKDAVIARIGGNANVTASGVNVEAYQKTTADLFGGTAGIGGTGGAGISVAVATLRSNVVAASLGDLDVKGGAVKVTATSNGGNVTPEEGSEEEARMKSLKADLGDKFNFTKRSIRVIGLGIGGGGTVGAGMSAAAARLDNVTSATLGGTIKNAGSVAVGGKADYDNVLAATLAGAGAGKAALAASVGVALANGEVSSKIDGSADISLTGSDQKVSVTTDSTVNSNAYALTGAVAGYGALSAGVAVAKNNLTQNTTVERGASIKSDDGTAALDVLGTSNTAAETGLIGVTGAIGALGVSVAVSNVKPTLNTTVGVEGEGGETTLDNLGAVKIANETISSGDSGMVSVSAGGVAVQASVMCVYNETEATAKAANIKGSMKSLNIEGDLGAKGDAKLLAVTLGLGAVGVTVSHVDVDSTNTAALDADNFTANVDSLTVRAGQDDDRFTTTTDAHALAAKAGYIAIGVNTAVARNRAKNIASITGSGDLNAKKVTLDAYSRSSADSCVTGVSVGLADVAVSVASTLNEATSKATMKLGGALNGTLSVKSEVDGTTDSMLETGSGSLIGVMTNVATSYGLTNSLIDVEIGKAPAEGTKTSISAVHTGKDTVNNTIDNLIGLSGISVGVMVGAAHSQDVYDTKVKLGGGTYDANKVKVTTDYETVTNSTVTPSSSGVDINAIKVAANKSVATNTAYGGAQLALKDATLKTGKAVDVTVNGKANADAVVKPPKFTLSGAVNVAVNTTKADMSAVQAASLAMDNSTLTTSGSLNVKSTAKKAEANAVVSSGGIDEDDEDSITLGGVTGESNFADAYENMASTAAILGTGSAENNKIEAASLKVFSGVANNVQTKSTARTVGAETYSALAVGNLDGVARSGDSFNVVVDGVNADIKGDASLKTKTDTVAKGDGEMPGSWSIVGVGVSNMNAQVGSASDKETSKVLIGSDTTLEADTVDIEARNKGDAYANVKKGLTVAIVSVGVSSQPTKSWYDTGVSIGDNAKVVARKDLIEEDWDEDETLKGKYAMSIVSDSSSKATSDINAKQVGALFNLNLMKADNSVSDENNISIGKGAELTSTGSMNIKGRVNTVAHAENDLNGGGLIDGSNVTAINNIDRVSRVVIDDGAKLTSSDGTINITSISGDADNIYTEGTIDNGGLISVGDADVTTNVTSENHISIGSDAEVTSYGDTNLKAIATSHKSNGSMGIYTHASVDAGGGIIVPDADADAVLKFTACIDVNKGGAKTSQIKTNGTDVNDGQGGNVNMTVSNEGLNVSVESTADGGAVGGGSYADGTLKTGLYNVIWVDRANLMAQGNVTLKANNGEAKKPKLKVRSHGELYAGAGEVESNVKLSGDPYNQVKTSSKSNVRVMAADFVHVATDPKVNMDSSTVKLENPCDYATGTLVFPSRSKVWDWEAAKYRCDWCYKGSTRKVSTTTSMSPTAVSDAFDKALAPISDIQRAVNDVNAITKAHYGEEDRQAADEIYATDLTAVLTQDVSVPTDGIRGYRLWTNSVTNMDVYLLPNAMRLYTIGDMNLKFVAEILHGDVRGNGEAYDIDIITALTANAVKNPTISVGSTGSLDFLNGTVSIPDQADLELYLHEISADWLIEKLDTDFIRRLDAGQQEINEAVLTGKALPEGRIVNDVVEDGTVTIVDEATGEAQVWKRYWLGDTPGTSTDADQVLVFLLVNEETDEVDAFRTSLSMLEAGEAPVDVSLYLYRDGKSDRRGEERYNAMFFDTPAGEKSLVKVVTNVLMGRKLEMPKALKIVLRIFWLDGGTLRAYSISDHFYALDDGTDGIVSMFGGAYLATFDGDTFESDYTKIEGILDGDLNVTIKRGQSVWPGRNKDGSVSDPEGNVYRNVDGVWRMAEEGDRADLPEDAAAA